MEAQRSPFRGTAFVLIGIVLCFASASYASYCNGFFDSALSAQATVVGVEEVRENNIEGNDIQGYIWDISYLAEGEEVLATFYGNTANVYEVGQEIAILYDPTNPGLVSVEEGGNWISGVGVVAAVFCIACGAADLVFRKKAAAGEDVPWFFR